MLRRHLPDVEGTIRLLLLQQAPPGAAHHRTVRPVRERVACPLKGEQRHGGCRELVFLRAAIVIGPPQAPESVFFVLLSLQPIECHCHRGLGDVAAASRPQEHPLASGIAAGEQHADRWRDHRLGLRRGPDCCFGDNSRRRLRHQHCRKFCLGNLGRFFVRLLDRFFRRADVEPCLPHKTCGRPKRETQPQLLRRLCPHDPQAEHNQQQAVDRKADRPDGAVADECCESLTEPIGLRRIFVRRCCRLRLRIHQTGKRREASQASDTSQGQRSQKFWHCISTGLTLLFWLAGWLVCPGQAPDKGL